MNRPAQLLLALAGLWGGAFAWNRAAMPHRERVPRLTYTGEREPAGPSTTLPAWPDRHPPDPDLVRVQRDLFAPSTARTVARPRITSTPEPVPVPSATPPPWRYVGFVADGSGRKVLVSGEGGVRAVAEGDLLPGGWKVQRIEAGRIVLQDTVSRIEATISRDR